MNKLLFSQLVLARRRLECRAVVAGILAGIVMRHIEIWFFRFFESFVDSQGVSAGETGGWMLVGIIIALMSVLFVSIGFAAAYFSRSSPYLQALAAMCITCIANFLGRVLTRFSHEGLNFDVFIFVVADFIMMLVVTLIACLGAYYGAYMAQSFKRNRGVQID